MNKQSNTPKNNWCDILQLDKTKTIKYLEIGSLHGGSVYAFHNNFGPNVISETIDPFNVCDHYQDYNENENNENNEIFKYNTKSLNNTHYKIYHHIEFYQHYKIIITMLLTLMVIIISLIYSSRSL